MKKIKWILSSLALAIFTGAGPVTYASSPPSIKINGSMATNPYGVYAEKGKLLLPVRWVAQQLGAQSITWDAKAKTVNITMDYAFAKYKKLLSYVNGLTPREAKREAELCPLSEEAKQIVLPKLPVMTNFSEDGAQVNDKYITISVNDVPFAAYNTKEISGHIFISPNLIQDLFNIGIQFDQESDVISIHSLSEKEIDRQLEVIEKTLLPKTPKEALFQWGHGEQTRSGAFQYAALSNELRVKALKQVNARGSWTTGLSSPWIGPISIAEENKPSEKMVEYTITYPEITSAGSTQGMEKLVIEKRTVDGKEGWFITRLLFGDPAYGIVPAEAQPPAERIQFTPLQ
jgi:hypothetical protein